MEASRNPIPDAIQQIKDLTKQAYLQRKTGKDILVKWSSNRQFGGITIFDPVNAEVETIGQFSEKAFVVLEQPWNVPVNNREKNMYIKKEQPTVFNYYVALFLKEWEQARIPNENEY
jgi:hypothetical protein